MKRLALFALMALQGSLPGEAVAGIDSTATLERAMAAAEMSLKDGEIQAAESHYRDALLEGWLLMGTLARVQGRPQEARDAFRWASTSAVENWLALQALALSHLQLGESAPAVEILARLVSKDRKDVPSRRLLAQALTAGAAGLPGATTSDIVVPAAVARQLFRLGFNQIAFRSLGEERVDPADTRTPGPLASRTGRQVWPVAVYEVSVVDAVH